MVYNPDEIEKDDYNGGCWKCCKQLKLTGDLTNCDNCKSLIRWNCNSCHVNFDIVDKESNKKLNECKVCGYFVCPNCGVCYNTCDKYKWQKEILKILSDEIPIGKFPMLPKKVNEIVEYIISIKISMERKVCIRNVPISYAKSKIKNLLSKVEGFRVKNENDRKEFLKRIDEATELPIGTEITISKIRENGSYGQEYRDALNLLVCLGKYEIKWIKDKDNNDYCVFVRCELPLCEYLNRKDLVIKSCPKCKKTYDRKVQYCYECIWSKGNNKGERVELKERLNSCDTCQMYRGNFKVGNGKA